LLDGSLEPAELVRVRVEETENNFFEYSASEIEDFMWSEKRKRTFDCATSRDCSKRNRRQTSYRSAQDDNE
jgi:hypothetical protein